MEYFWDDSRSRRARVDYNYPFATERARYRKPSQHWPEPDDHSRYKVAGSNRPYRRPYQCSVRDEDFEYFQPTPASLTKPRTGLHNSRGTALIRQPPTSHVASMLESDEEIHCRLEGILDTLHTMQHSLHELKKTSDKHFDKMIETLRSGQQIAASMEDEVQLDIVSSHQPRSPLPFLQLVSATCPPSPLAQAFGPSAVQLAPFLMTTPIPTKAIPITVPMPLTTANPPLEEKPRQSTASGVPLPTTVLILGSPKLPLLSWPHIPAPFFDVLVIHTKEPIHILDTYFNLYIDYPLLPSPSTITILLLACMPPPLPIGIDPWPPPPPLPNLSSYHIPPSIHWLHPFSPPLDPIVPNLDSTLIPSCGSGIHKYLFWWTGRPDYDICVIPLPSQGSTSSLTLRRRVLVGRGE